MATADVFSRLKLLVVKLPSICLPPGHHWQLALVPRRQVGPRRMAFSNRALVPTSFMDGVAS